MRLAATDEDGSATVAVTSGATTLLSTELLAGARHIRALPRRASRSTALFKLPCHHAMQNISARFQSRSEEHTSELQSLMRISYAVFCLKKKKKSTTSSTHKQ